MIGLQRVARNRRERDAMQRRYIKIYFKDWERYTANLSASEKGRLVVALLSYAKGEPYIISENERFAFEHMRGK